jgi:hypothetical protein
MLSLLAESEQHFKLIQEFIRKCNMAFDIEPATC